MAEHPTVLVRMSPEIVAQLEQQGWEFGQADAEGFHSPTVHVPSEATWCPCGGACHHERHPCSFACTVGEGNRNRDPDDVGEDEADGDA